MITSAAAKKLRALIKAQADAEREEAFAGSQPPAEAEIIRLELANAKLELEKFIDELTARGT